MRHIETNYILIFQHMYIKIGSWYLPVSLYMNLAKVKLFEAVVITRF